MIMNIMCTHLRLASLALVAVGYASFAVSDALLGIDRVSSLQLYRLHKIVDLPQFAIPLNDHVNSLVLVTYYTAQILIAASLPWVQKQGKAE